MHKPVGTGNSFRSDLQRRAERYAMRRPVRYRLIGHTDWRQATTLNISQSGIMIFGTLLPEIGDEIELRIRLGVEGLPPIACQVSAKALVVRRIEAAATDSSVGARFQEYRLSQIDSE